MEIGETDETESVGNSSSTVLINYGTGMPIDLIYSFLKEDYETKGYDDALSIRMSRIRK